MSNVLSLSLSLVLAALILLALAQVKGVLVTVLVGIILTEALRPSLRKLESWGLPRSVALLAVFLGLLGVGGLAVALVLPPALIQLKQLLDGLPAYLSRLQNILVVADIETDLLKLGLEGARTAGIQLFGRVPGLVGQLISVPLTLFSTAFASITVVLLAILWLSATQQLDRTLVAQLDPKRGARARIMSRERVSG